MPFAADLIQAVCFTAPNERMQDALKLWPLLFGGEGPDGFQKTANSPTLQSVATGQSEGFFCNLTVQVGRVDIILTENNPTFAGPPLGDPARIGDVRRGIDVAARHLRRVASIIRPIRFAIVVDTAETTSLEYQESLLREQLAVLSVPASATDLQFQVNVRQNFECDPSIQMNRLCIVSSGQAGFFQVVNGVPASPILQPFVGVKFDVNTAPEAELPKNIYDVVIDELAKEANRLHVTGLAGLWSSDIGNH